MTATLSVLLPLLTLGAAEPTPDLQPEPCWAEVSDGEEFWIGWDGEAILRPYTLVPEQLESWTEVDNGFSILDAEISFTMFDLDVPWEKQTEHGCTVTLLEWGDITVDGVTIGDFTKGAVDKLSTNTFTLDGDMLGALAADGRLDVVLRFYGHMDNPCDFCFVNESEWIESVRLDCNFDPNYRPHAVALVEDATAGDDCLADVLLDGSASTDADSTNKWNDIRSYEWYLNKEPVGPPDFTGEIVNVQLPPGDYTAILLVTDFTGFTDTDEVTFTVWDRPNAGSYQAWASPSILWPPNHRYVEIDYGVNWIPPCALGGGDAVPLDPALWVLVNVTSDEPDDAPGMGDGATTEDVVLLPDGTLFVRAERAATGDGRIYQLYFEVYDLPPLDGGVVIQALHAFVIVPHAHTPRGP